MAKTYGWCLALTAALSLAVSSAAQEPVAPALEPAFSGAILPFQQFHPTPLMTPDQQKIESEAAKILINAQSTLPAPNPAIVKWLASRIPGLDVNNLHEVPFELGEQVFAKAAAAKVTWMDVLSDPAFRGSDLYFVTQDTLNRLDAKYNSGLVPVRSQTEDGHTFQMQGFVGGQGKVHLLFNYTEFTFKDPDTGQRYKIDDGGRLTGSIRGPGDIDVQGFSAYGAPIFCPWARINRMQKESQYKVKVYTSCGDRGGKDLHPVRAR